MKQIKTIVQKYADDFDKKVNRELAEGWQLVKRYQTTDYYFVAELEKVTILPEERRCDNCQYKDRAGNQVPCYDCEDASHWKEPR